MIRLGWVVAAALAAAGCNQPGEVVVELDGDVPAAAETALVYVVPDATCECACGACLPLCEDGGCVFGCGGARCPVDDLADIVVAPGPGSWALVLDFFDADGVLIASACAQLDIDRDGAEDKRDTATLSSCVGDPPDAGP